MSRRSKRSPDLFDTTGSSGTSPETSGRNVEATEDELAHGETDRVARVLKKIKDGGLRQELTCTDHGGRGEGRAGNSTTTRDLSGRNLAGGGSGGAPATGGRGGGERRL